MKSIIKELFQAFAAGGLIPALLLGFVFLYPATDSEAAQTQPALRLEAEPAETKPAEIETIIVPQPLTQPAEPAEVYITVIRENESCQWPLEAYIVGVVLGEMPADFELEALKAQAVVARTYTLKICQEGKKHGGAVCTESSCCQAYRSDSQYLSSGGTEEKLMKVKQAVQETQGQVLQYEGELITATYFSCSGGATEDAVAVWGYEVPYLQSVESPGEEGASAYYREKRFTAEEFCKKMSIRLSSDPKSWFGTVTYTEGGGVETIAIGGVVYKGTTIRSLLGLRSTKFEVDVTEGIITFRTKGYGHRVGMSQYGANAMALAGNAYQDILAHYYTGAVLTQCTN